MAFAKRKTSAERMTMAKTCAPAELQTAAKRRDGSLRMVW
jgi:hypothetical protein